ncbi:hypothetical protein ACFLRN_04175 [Thermoproteota archaeon]
MLAYSIGRQLKIQGKQKLDINKSAGPATAVLTTIDKKKLDELTFIIKKSLNDIGEILKRKTEGPTNFFFIILNGLGNIAGVYIYYYESPSFPFLVSAVLFVPCLFLTICKIHDPTKREE